MEEDNECIELELYSRETTENDFETLESCEENLRTPLFLRILIIGVMGIILIGGVGLFFYLNKRGKKRR